MAADADLSTTRVGVARSGETSSSTTTILSVVEALTTRNRLAFGVGRTTSISPSRNMGKRRWIGIGGAAAAFPRDFLRCRRGDPAHGTSTRQRPRVTQGSCRRLRGFHRRCRLSAPRLSEARRNRAPRESCWRSIPHPLRGGPDRRSVSRVAQPRRWRRNTDRSHATPSFP